MLPEERLQIASLSYQRALAAARRRSTSPTSWRRLLTAARNLADARRDREKAGGKAVGGAAPAPRLAKVVSLRVRAGRRRTRALERS